MGLKISKNKIRLYKIVIIDTEKSKINNNMIENISNLLVRSTIPIVKV